MKKNIPWTKDQFDFCLFMKDAGLKENELLKLFYDEFKIKRSKNAIDSYLSKHKGNQK